VDLSKKRRAAEARKKRRAADAERKWEELSDVIRYGSVVAQLVNGYEMDDWRRLDWAGAMLSERFGNGTENGPEGPSLLKVARLAAELWEDPSPKRLKALVEGTEPVAHFELEKRTGGPILRVDGVVGKWDALVALAVLYAMDASYGDRLKRCAYARCNKLFVAKGRPDQTCCCAHCRNRYKAAKPLTTRNTGDLPCTRC
jgi:hypothetical protein